ncbi:MAG TPA: hypothetical protein ENK26_08040 [Gammaproteobacteria bacterium]|nr:hypothetical protein [Gammaproteobacteria bacterium]
MTRRQPLYLDGSEPIDIQLDGPALAITRAGEATRLLPLRLLSHILTHGGNIHWSQAALLACAGNDIPIFLTDATGRLVGSLRANSDTPSPDWQRLMRLIEDPDGIDHYHLYLKAKATQIQRDISDRWTELPEIRLPGYYRTARIIRSALRSDLEAELHRRGFRRRLIPLRQAGVNLAADLGKTLEPCVHWIINETWKKDCLGHQFPLDQPPTRKLILHHYEHHRDFIRDTIAALVISFLYWLGETDTQLKLT